MTVYFLADDYESSLTVEIDHEGSEKLSIKGAYVKIGRTRQDVNKRLSQLQTGNPRLLKFMGYIKTENEEEDRKIEGALQKKYDSKKVSGEWYKLHSEEVLDEIREFPYRGFLAVSEDSLKFLGRDRDGIPEIGGVWDWGDLHWEDCCPYCGCICGLIYEEKIMIHECLNCGYQLLEDDMESAISDG